MQKKLKVVILAAGLGTRMKSGVPKALHTLSGRPMISYVLRAARSLGVEEVICVLGRKARAVRRVLGGATVVTQKRPLGSGDALNRARGCFRNFKGNLLVLYADEPLVRPATLERLVREHLSQKADCTLLGARVADPTGYGRIVTDDNGGVVKIVEEIEASVYEKAIEVINVGAYCFRCEGFFALLGELENKNKKKEYFLTDAIALMHRKGLKVRSVTTDDKDEALGINSRRELAAAERILNERACLRLMDKGVAIVDPATAYIDEEAEIGEDSVIYPNTIIEENVKIGRRCRVGPFARIRPGCALDDGVEIGNFVEIVRTRIGRDTKVKHHTYLGDAVVGRGVNVGAGTITANYDGKAKFITTIEDGAFLGSGTVLVAPVKIGANAVTGAGAVVTRRHDVPPGEIVAGVPARILKKSAKRKRRVNK